MTPATDPTDAKTIEQSLEIAGEPGGDLTLIVYARLFEREPAMKALFWRDMGDTIKGEMLMRTFEAILDFIRGRQFADHMIQTEVVTHAGYDVPPEVSATFFSLVAEVVEEACGAEWSSTMAEAWRRTSADRDRYVANSGKVTL